MPGQQEAAQELMLGVLSMGTAPEERGRHVPIQAPPRPLRHPSRSSAGSGPGRPHMRLAEGPGRAASSPTGDPARQRWEPEPHQQAEAPPFQGPARRFPGSSVAPTPQLPGPGARHQQQLPPRREFQDLRVSSAAAEAQEASWAAGASLEGSLRQQGQGGRHRSRPPEGGPVGSAAGAPGGRQPGIAPQQHQPRRSAALPLQQQAAQGAQQPAPASSQQQLSHQQQQQGDLTAGAAPGQPRTPSRTSTDELSSQTLQLTQLLPRLGETLRAASTGGERWPHREEAGVQRQLQPARPATEFCPAPQGSQAGSEVALPTPTQDVAAGAQHRAPAISHCPRSPSFAGDVSEEPHNMSIAQDETLQSEEGEFSLRAAHFPSDRHQDSGTPDFASRPAHATQEWGAFSPQQQQLRRQQLRSWQHQQAQRGAQPQQRTEPCKFYLQTGRCAFGDTCKFEHPPKERLPVVQMNSVGLPIRQGEPDCRFYVQNGRCGFGMSCRFHHSEPVPGGLATPLGQALMQQQLHQHQLHMQQPQPPLGMQPMASGLQQLQVGGALGMALPAGMPMAGLGLPMPNNMGLAVAGMQGMQGVPSFAMHSPVAGATLMPAHMAAMGSSGAPPMMAVLGYPGMIGLPPGTGGALGQMQALAAVSQMMAMQGAQAMPVMGPGKPSAPLQRDFNSMQSLHSMDSGGSEAGLRSPQLPGRGQSAGLMSDSSQFGRRSERQPRPGGRSLRGFTGRGLATPQGSSSSDGSHSARTSTRRSAPRPPYLHGGSAGSSHVLSQARSSSAQQHQHQHQHQQQGVHEYTDPARNEPLAQAPPRDTSPHRPQRQGFDEQLVHPGAAPSPPAARHSAVLPQQAAAAACGLPAAEGSAPVGAAAAAHCDPASGRAAPQLSAASQPGPGPHPEQQPALGSLEAPEPQSAATLRPASATWRDSSSATGPVGDAQPVDSEQAPAPAIAPVYAASASEIAAAKPPHHRLDEGH